MDNKNSRKALLQKFLNGQCTKREIDLLIEFLRDNPDAADLPDFEEVTFRLHRLGAMESEMEEAVFQRIMQKADHELSPSRKFLFPFWMKIAAGLTAIILISAFVYQYVTANQITSYTTAYGETRTLTLDDGSVVTLNSNSSLRMKPHWQQNQARVVTLTGEAFFKVKHTLNHQKFVVETDGDMKVVVLGTEFNVNSRDEVSQVVLSSGKVQVVTESEKDITMAPGEMVAFEQDEKKWVKKSVDTKYFTSWRNNLLLFRETSLEEIALLLKSNFGYNIVFEDDSIRELAFTGSNPADSPELLLETLQKSFGLAIDRRGQELFLRRN